ncbi:hypothetical protein DL93DRAFT_1175271 [Clavulina sp. PMI_390]|nr:hypothetical protein DL93DRAFT_1175271 [Clavulina sp. PMI_390]
MASAGLVVREPSLSMSASSSSSNTNSGPSAGPGSGSRSNTNAAAASGRYLHQSPPSGGGRPTSNLSELGIVLPSLHLGSFSGMTSLPTTAPASVSRSASATTTGTTGTTAPRDRNLSSLSPNANGGLDIADPQAQRLSTASSALTSSTSQSFSTASESSRRSSPLEVQSQVQSLFQSPLDHNDNTSYVEPRQSTASSSRSARLTDRSQTPSTINMAALDAQTGFPTPVPSSASRTTHEDDEDNNNNTDERIAGGEDDANVVNRGAMLPQQGSYRELNAAYSNHHANPNAIVNPPSRPASSSANRAATAPGGIASSSSSFTSPSVPPDGRSTTVPSSSSSRPSASRRTSKSNSRAFYENDEIDGQFNNNGMDGNASQSQAYLQVTNSASAAAPRPMPIDYANPTGSSDSPSPGGYYDSPVANSNSWYGASSPDALRASSSAGASRRTLSPPPPLPRGAAAAAPGGETSSSNLLYAGTHVVPGGRESEYEASSKRERSSYQPQSQYSSSSAAKQSQTLPPTNGSSLPTRPLSQSRSSSSRVPVPAYGTASSNVYASPVAEPRSASSSSRTNQRPSMGASMGQPVPVPVSVPQAQAETQGQAAQYGQSPPSQPIQFPQSQSQRYPSQQQQPPQPQAPPPPPEEVCIECMMRDRDMADVDVSTPGVWERESDVWYEELCRREVEDSRRGIKPGSSGNNARPTARGGALTEANLAVWLTMNPKEPAARWQTLEKYVHAQIELLAAENDAREATRRERGTQDSKVRDTFQYVRRSVAGGESPAGPGVGAGGHRGEASVGGERGPARASMGAESSLGSAGDRNSRGIKLRASTTYDEFDPYALNGYAKVSPGGPASSQTQPNTPYSPGPYGYPHPNGPPGSGSVTAKRRSQSKDRDVTLLESGLIMERVDLQREEREERDRRRAEEREERRRTRKVSRVSVSGIPPASGPIAGYGNGAPAAAGFSDGSSMHSASVPIQGVNYGGSRSQISLIPASPSMSNSPNVPASTYAARRMSSPMTLTPPARPRVPASGGSNESAFRHSGARFFGFRHWSGAFGSEASLHHNSGSMMDMHLGLEQDDMMLHAAQHEQPWTISQLVDEPEGALDEPPPITEKDKRSSIGRLWKKMTGGKEKSSGGPSKRSQSRPAEDYTMPLDPPPPISYLVSRTPHDRSSQRHATSSSRQSQSIPNSPTPRTHSTPVSPGFGPPTINTQFIDPGSPTVGTSRYSPRDSDGSGGEDKRFSQYADAQYSPYVAEDGMYERNEWGPSQRLSMQPNNNSRRISVASSDKDLPPLPNGAGPAQHPPPMTSHSFPALRPASSYEVIDLRPPIVPFKSERRQSFSGRVSSLFGGNNGSKSRLDHDADLVPPPQSRFGPYAGPGNQEYAYGNSNGFYRAEEFGQSTPSLRRWGSDDEPPMSSQLPIAHTTYSIASSRKEKRSSRSTGRGLTGRLSAIFGGNGGSGPHHTADRGTMSLNGSMLNGGGAESINRQSFDRDGYVRQDAMNGVGLAPSDGERYARQRNGYPSASINNTRASRSEMALRESVSSFVTFPRNSMASSRRYEAAIPQERDFVAMRYPTESERLNLMRQA